MRHHLRMSKRRTYVVFSVATALLIGSTISSVSAAAPKIGSACKTAGIFFDTQSTRYVCNKEGKKLVWRTWYPAAARNTSTSSTATTPAPAQSKTPAAAATPSKPLVQNPIPITLPAAQVGTISFENITQHISDIPRAAWDAVQKVIAANSLPSIPTTIAVGPNTTPNVSDISVPFQKTMKLWSGFRQPSTYYALIFNFQDKDWALKKAATIPAVIKSGGINGPDGMPGRIAACAAPTQCSSANSGIEDPDGAGLGQFGMDPAHNAVDPYFQYGGIEGHEYTHSVQAAQFLDTPNVGKPATNLQRQHGLSNAPSGLYEGVVPCWMAEGQANFNGTAAATSTFDEYSSWRLHMPKGWPNPDFTDYSAASLQKLLETDMPPDCLPPASIYKMGYGIGALVIEELTAIAGPQSDMALVTLMSRDLTFAQAFEKVYGISWAKAAPILAQVAAVEYAATP